MANINSSNTNIIVSAAGAVTRPLQPAFCAYRSSAVTNVTGDGTQYTVIFDSTLSNQGSCYNTGTGVFTAPVTGNYMFSSSLYFTNAGAAAGTMEMILKVNATLMVLCAYQAANIVFSNQAVICGSIMVPLTASDTVVIVGLTSGGSKTTGINGGAGNTGGTSFSGYLVC